jgi:hypothetical protein
MKLHGYCLKCHKIKRVNVNPASLGSTPIGICDECEEKK